MKNYPHIISKVYGEPWVITPDKHAAIRKTLESKLGESVGTGNFDEYNQRGVEAPDYEYPEPKTVGRTRIIPIYGIIGKHLSRLELICGGCSLDAVNALLSDAQNDAAIERVILDFDSPGGTVVGVPETAELIRRLAAEKDTIAYCEALCCSGGYWLASQASQFVCTESSLIGSIGVYSLFFDESRALEKDGIKPNPISAGEFKLSGAWFKPMTDKEREMFQRKTDAVYAKFKAAVNTVRTVADEYCQGQVLYGDDALEAGLVDAIVDDIEDLL